MATVIVPAHNEEAVIQDCLNSIIKQPEVSKIIVACNGCTDKTYDIVSQAYPSVTCLDIKKPSKVNALNEAEKHIADYPVFYIDADTRLSENCIPLVAEKMRKNNILLAAPTPVINTKQSSWLVQQYYKIWLKLPYIQEGVIATCSYIISETGRKRFEKFPEIINDDGFVRGHFSEEELSNISDTYIYISAPKDIYSLIKIKTRARLGNIQLQAKKLVPVKHKKNYTSTAKEQLFSKHFISAFAYYGIATIIRIRSKLQYRKINQYRWEKDLSSR